MKKHCFISLFVIIGMSLNAQEPFRIKVVDSKTTEGIAKALVFIEEIPVPDQETDPSGLVTYQNVPTDRKVRVNVRKKGYFPQQVEIVASKEIKVDNNIVIKLEKESLIPQVTIYGEVTDENDEEIEGATVEVTILGKPFSAVTDPSGNYQIRIDGSTLKSVPSFQIEVKKKGCERVKSTESVLQSDYINKDFKLSCLDSPAVEIDHSFEKDNLLFQVKSCRQTGDEITCTIQIVSRNEDNNSFGAWKYNSKHTRIIDDVGNEYLAKSIKLANINNQNNNFGATEKTLISNFPIEGVFVFGNVTRKVPLLPKIEIYAWSHKPENKFLISFRNVPVK